MPGYGSPALTQACQLWIADCVSTPLIYINPLFQLYLAGHGHLGQCLPGLCVCVCLIKATSEFLRNEYKQENSKSYQKDLLITHFHGNIVTLPGSV